MTPAGRIARPGGRRENAATAVSGAVAFGLLLAGGALASPAVLSPSDVVSAKGLEGFVKAERLPVPEAAFLAEGRAIWAENCENCHGGDALTGAPKITSEKKWAKRIAKGLPMLFVQAKQGFLGPTYKEMPARGGNSDLTDREVEAAVAFMVWTSGGAAEVEAWLAKQ